MGKQLAKISWSVVSSHLILILTPWLTANTSGVDLMPAPSTQQEAATCICEQNRTEGGVLLISSLLQAKSFWDIYIRK